MATDGDEREFRIKPRRPRRVHSDEPRTWAMAFRKMMRFAQMSSMRSRRQRSAASATRRFRQRCAVRVTYATNKMRGQWAAHGRYISRESATQNDSERGTCFGPSDRVEDPAATIGAWQTAGDPRLFKLIISPEFGDRLDLELLTRGLMTRMERDLGTRLEWLGAIHRNTEYPHVHVALRGVTDRGQALRLDHDYIKNGIRHIAEDLATAQLGYRTELDAQESQRREIHQQRYTSLDRILNGNNGRPNDVDQPEYFAVDLTPLREGTAKQNLSARLLTLQTMGLAESSASGQWHVRADFETILRAMQRTADRQRALASRSALLSDPRLPSRVTDLKSISNLTGRVLGHGEDESTGRAYMILEGTDRQIHFIYHTPQMETARNKGELRTNCFVRVRRQNRGAKDRVFIDDFGDANRLLNNKRLFAKIACMASGRVGAPVDGAMSGWLGKYEAALAMAVEELYQARKVRRTDRMGGRS